MLYHLVLQFLQLDSSSQFNPADGQKTRAGARLWWLWNGYTLLSLCVLCPFAVTYLYTYLTFVSVLRRDGSGKLPPTFPYVIPVLGHALSFARNAGSFSSSVA